MQSLRRAFAHKAPPGEYWVGSGPLGYVKQWYVNKYLGKYGKAMYAHWFIATGLTGMTVHFIRHHSGKWDDFHAARIGGAHDDHVHEEHEHKSH
eukprot:TRINITY_DN95663_c0_g1_i1.p1 TRINITY_DN95663_c0_g1~~TRINITY_DN95663_c0_g1_i1.p1  ORF type:complete len:101 (+),score=17.06 TRINITY_DN95663_c0_g1_i1:24-305(+)